MMNFVKTWVQSGAKECKSCRSRKMLKNAPIRPRWGEKNTATVCLSPQKNLLEAESRRQVSMDPVLLAPPAKIGCFSEHIRRGCVSLRRWTPSCSHPLRKLSIFDATCVEFALHEARDPLENRENSPIPKKCPDFAFNEARTTLPPFVRGQIPQQIPRQIRRQIR